MRRIWIKIQSKLYQYLLRQQRPKSDSKIAQSTHCVVLLSADDKGIEVKSCISEI